jgi:hypothetical protein
MDQNGVLVDDLPDPQSAASSSSAGVNPERWLEGIPAATKSSKISADAEQLPPAFSSLHLNAEDTSVKERVTSEENMKFPASIKSERARPETAPASHTSASTEDDTKRQ